MTILWNDSRGLGTKMERRFQANWSKQWVKRSRQTNEQHWNWRYIGALLEQGSSGMWNRRERDQAINKKIYSSGTWTALSNFDRDSWSRWNVGTVSYFNWKNSSERLTYWQQRRVRSPSKGTHWDKWRQGMKNL